MKKSFLIITAILATQLAHAWNGVAGLRINNGKASGASSEAAFGLQSGVLNTISINENVGFRFGGLLAMMDSKVKDSGLTLTYQHLRLLAPITVAFGTESVKGYAGFNAALKIASSCKVSGYSCRITDENSLVFQPTLGADFVVSPTMTVGAFYEFEAEFAEQYKQSSFGVNVSWIL